MPKLTDPMEYRGYLITETERGFLTDVPGCRGEYFGTLENAQREIDADIAANLAEDFFNERHDVYDRD